MENESMDMESTDILVCLHDWMQNTL